MRCVDDMAAGLSDAPLMPVVEAVALAPRAEPAGIATVSRTGVEVFPERTIAPTTGPHESPARSPEVASASVRAIPPPTSFWKLV